MECSSEVECAEEAGYRREGPYLEPFGRAVAAAVFQEKGAEGEDAGVVIADSAGVFGAAIRRGPLRGDVERVAEIPAVARR